MASRLRELKKNKESHSARNGVIKRQRPSLKDRKHRRGDREDGRDSSRKGRKSSYDIGIKRTLEWIQKLSAPPPDHPLLVHPRSPSSLYSQENIDLYFDAVPDQIKDLSFGMVMATNPKIFHLVLKKLKTDRDYFQWFEAQVHVPSVEDDDDDNSEIDPLGSTSTSQRRNAVASNFFPSKSSPDQSQESLATYPSLDYEPPDTREAHLRPQKVVSKNGLIFTDPFARDVQVPDGRRGPNPPPFTLIDPLGNDYPRVGCLTKILHSGSKKPARAIKRVVRYDD